VGLYRCIAGLQHHFIDGLYFIPLIRQLIGKTLAPFISLVIPAYNEEKRLAETFEHVFTFLDAQPYTAEVLLVENGSQDQTYELALSFAKRHPQLRVLQCSERGKGLAVRYGMLEAKGDYRFMCDADFSMPVEEINRFLPPQLNGYDIAIASREAPGAIRYNEPHYRHFVGRCFNALIRLIALPRLQDTQCGFKCFKSTAAVDLFQCQTLPGWSFDVEILFIARKRGYKIVEIPIPWFFNSESKIRVLHDSFRMALDLFKIRLNGLRGVYACKV
jgi:dolichyl-phosphate beta-glucosyltransferase